MFTPAGLLRDIACPYYLDGKCDRPHCILGHRTSNDPVIRNAPSPVIPSAYDYASRRSGTDEYDPAANYEMGMLRRSTTPTAYDPSVPSGNTVRENIIVPVGVSHPSIAPLPQNKLVKPSNLGNTTLKPGQTSTASAASKSVAKVASITAKTTSATSDKPSGLMRSEKRSLPSTQPVQQTADVKRNRDVLPATSSGKSGTALSSNKTSQVSTSSKGASDTISAFQILDKLDNLPKKLSPVDDGEESIDAADVCKRKKTNEPVSSDVIDLTEDSEPVVKKTTSAFATSSLVEAAALRCKRKLLSPADACEARIRECEKAASQKAASSSAQTFRPHTSTEGVRVAHVPRTTPTNAPLKSRPRIAIEFNAKVPTSIRQHSLDKLVEELLKSGKEAEWCFSEAVRLEKEAYGRSSNDKIYRQVIPNVVAKVRREQGSTSNVSPPKKAAVVSHAAMLLPAGAHMVGVGVPKPATTPSKDGAVTLTKSQIYRLLSKYKLNEEQLVSNGYPVLVPSADGTSVISIKPPDKRVTQRQSSLSNVQLAAGERECCRCQKLFRINPATGAFVKREECQYHPGRVQKVRTHARHIEQVYSCCQAVVGASNIGGCQLGATHVHEHNRVTDLEGFVSTKEDSNTPGIFALDCEMVYSLKGVELARVTVIDHNLKPVFDALVRPETEVLDYNTEFSGLKKCDFDHVTEKLHDIQRKMCSMINARSIIVGHSLESDLISLKIIHRNVVDTAMVFPHPQGPPYKRALRTLVSEILQKSIQQGIGGHDSFEDAASAMELMLFKVKSDFQKEGAMSASAVADRASTHRRNSFNSPLAK